MEDSIFLQKLISKLKQHINAAIQEFVSANPKIEVSSSEIMAVATNCANDIAKAAGLRLDAIPESWEEARAQVPDLKKWKEAKEAAEKEERNFTIIDHLRDHTYGYGKWTLSEQGLPTQMLFRIDRDAYTEFHQWSHRKDKTTGKFNKLPDDMNLPNRSEVIDQKLRNTSHAQIQEARRLLRAKDRRHKD